MAARDPVIFRRSMCIEGGGEEGNYGGARAAPKGHVWGGDTAGPSVMSTFLI